jgi:hypothetical protein
MKILIFVLLSFGWVQANSIEPPVRKNFIKGIHEASFTYGTCVFFSGMFARAVAEENQAAKVFLADYLEDKLQVEDYEKSV